MLKNEKHYHFLRENDGRVISPDKNISINTAPKKQTLNKHLERQLKRFAEEHGSVPETLAPLLKIISTYYDDCENDRKHLERIIDISSTEMMALNHQLKQDIERYEETQTELRKSKQEILAREAQLKASQRIGKTGSWEMPLHQLDNLNANPLYWSDETYRIFGYEPGEVVVTNDLFDAHVHPEDFPKLCIVFREAIRTRKGYESEHRIVLKDGTQKVIFERGEIKCNPETGEPVSAIGILQDISDWKKIQEQILSSEAQLKASQKIAKIGSWELPLDDEDINANPLYWSDETYRIFGYEPGEIIATNELFDKHVHPDDLERVTAAFRESLRTGEVYSIEHRIILNDGTEKIIFERGEVKHNPVTGYPVRVIGTVQDIGEWKKIQEKIVTSEAHLKASQRIAHIGSWQIDIPSMDDITNPDSYILHWSDELFRLMGFKPGEVVPSNELFMSITHPDDREVIMDMFRKAITAGEIYNIEQRFVLPDGTEKLVYVRGEAETDPVTGKIKIIGTTQDISEWKTIQEKIIHSETHLKTSQRIAKIGSWEMKIKLSEPENLETYQIKWSDENYRIFGYEPGEVETTADLFFMHAHPEDMPAINAAFLKSIETGAPFIVEHGLTTKDGVEKVVFVTSETEIDYETGYLRIIGTTQDITESKKIQEKIITSEAQLKASQRIGKIGSWEMPLHHLDNLNANPLYWSDETYRIFGYAPGEVAMTNDLFDSHIHPDDFPNLCVVFREAIRTRKGYESEHRIVLRDGTQKVIFERGEIKCNPETGEPESVIGTLQDISDGKKIQEMVLNSEANLKASQRIAKIGSWEFEATSLEEIHIPGSYHLKWSDENYRIFGYKPGEIELTHEILLKHIGREDLERIHTVFLNALETRASYGIEHMITLADGTEKVVFERGEVIPDPENKRIKVIGTTQDITELKKIQEQVTSNEAHLKASQRIAKIGSWELDLANLEDLNANTLKWSDESFRIFGFEPNETEVTNDLFFNLVHPDDRALVAQTFINALDEGNNYTIEHRIITPDGTQKIVVERGEIETDLLTGRKIKVIGTVQDITGWKEINERILNSEANLSASQHIAKVGSWMIEMPDVQDPSTYRVEWSDETYRIFGLDPGTIKPDNDLFFSLVHPDDIRRTEDSFFTATQTGMLDEEHRIITPQGEEKIVRERAEVQYDPVTQKPSKILGITQDITEWKKTQEKLLIGQASLNASQRIAKVGSWVVDFVDAADYNTSTTTWSEENYRIFGLELGVEVTADMFFSMVHPQDLDAVKQAFPKAFETGSMTQEYRIITAQGIEKTVSEKAEVEYDPKTRKPIKIQGTTQDITEQKLAELSLKKTEANLRNLLENSDTAYALLDPEGRIVTFNARAMALAEKEFEKPFVVGGKYVDWMLPQRRNEVEQSINKVVTERAKLSYEVRYKQDDGIDLWLYVRMNPILNEDNDVLGLSVAATNITETKLAEWKVRESNERYTMATRATNDVIWDWDLTTNQFYRSDNYGQVFGYPVSKDNLYIHDWSTAIHPDDRDRVQMAVIKIVNTPGATFWQDEYKLFRANGEIAYVLDKAHIIHDDEGKPVRMVGAMQDITAKKRNELETKKLTSDLIQRNKDLEQFAYIVSHNLRAPVANIIGFANAMREYELSDAEKLEYLNGLSVSAGKLDQVILDLNHILQMKHEINELRENVKFSAITDDILLSLHSTIKDENIEFITDFSSADEMITLKSYIYSIFYNLIINAIKYRRQDIKSIIEIRSSVEHKKITLTFSDNGMGIDLQRKGHLVFGLYKRFHRNVEGKGMGLYMVKTQVETLGGKISLSSQVNEGTQFCIEFEA